MRYGSIVAYFARPHGPPLTHAQVRQLMRGETAKEKKMTDTFTIGMMVADEVLLVTEFDVLDFDERTQKRIDLANTIQLILDRELDNE